MKNEKIDLKSKVEEWLTKEGYSLEFYVATQFKKSKFLVKQGVHVRDNLSDLVREIDVLATNDLGVNDHTISIEHVIECKWSKDKPWVIFTSDNSIHPAACITQSFGSILGRTLLWHIAGNEGLYDTSYFNSPHNAGFAGRQALSNGKDLFYNAIQSITGVTELRARSHDSSNLPFTLPKLAAIVFPVIVVDGELYEANYDEENDKVMLTETNHVRLHWKGSETWKLHSTVDIVTKSYIGEFSNLRKNELLILQNNLAKALENTVECFNERSLEKLNIKVAPRGFSGLPAILEHISQIELMNKNVSQ